MHDHIEFETPENIQVSYHPAGLGTRFIAWFLDNILVFFVMIGMLLLMMCAGTATEGVMRDIAESFRDVAEDMDEDGPPNIPKVMMYMLGLWLLLWGLGSFFYFGLSELFLRGQTLGKRLMQIRVVKSDGFSLNPVGILVRNIFRVIDHLPPLWIVPLVSANSQRLGDMVAGTLVVVDKPEEISDVRAALSSRTVEASMFRFDVATLKRARPQDFEAIERILERWHSLSLSQQDSLSVQLITSLAKRLQTDVPPQEIRLVYLQDLLAAEYRRQNRSLG